MILAERHSALWCRSRRCIASRRRGRRPRAGRSGRLRLGLAWRPRPGRGRRRRRFGVRRPLAYRRRRYARGGRPLARRRWRRRLRLGPAWRPWPGRTGRRRWSRRHVLARRWALPRRCCRLGLAVNGGSLPSNIRRRRLRCARPWRLRRRLARERRSLTWRRRWRRSRPAAHFAVSFCYSFFWIDREDSTFARIHCDASRTKSFHDVRNV